jgi:sugar phosphate isomerase/epimerase
MKIGLSSFAFRWAFNAGMTVQDFLEKSSSYGADVVQLCENTGVDRFEKRELDDLAKELDKLNLAVECGGNSSDFIKMEAGILSTARLGGRIYRCVVDSDELSPATVAANLRSLLPLLRDSEVSLCVENHFKFAPQLIREIIEEVDDAAVGACLDPLNSIPQFIGTEETIRELIPFARTAHVKDAKIVRTEAGWTIFGTALGKGQFDLENYLATVAAKVDSLLLESWMDPIDGPLGSGTLYQEASWARGGLVLIRELSKRSN